MELTARQQAVLAAVVRQFIETGEPVGSKGLCAALENAPSPATVRNEMNTLCALGLLSQPHTSAGRVPTEGGYRFYVTRLMRKSAPTPQTKQLIDNALQGGQTEVKALPHRAAEVLYGLTGFPAMVCTFPSDSVQIRQVEWVPLGRQTVLLVLLTADGRTFSRSCRLSEAAVPDLRRRFEDVVRRHLTQKPLRQCSKAFLQNLILSEGASGLSLLQPLSILFETAQQAAEAGLCIVGKEHLTGFCSEAQVHRILAWTENCEPLVRLFAQCRQPNAVLFDGQAPPLCGLRDITVAAAEFKVGNRPAGRIGLVAPKRMAYEQIIPGIEYTAGRLTAQLTAAEQEE